jgi:acyl carrier protein
MTTVDRLRHVIKDALGTKRVLSISGAAPLDDIVTSSLQYVIILAEIERVFGIVVPEADLDPAKLRNLDSIAGIIERLRARSVE